MFSVKRLVVITLVLLATTAALVAAAVVSRTADSTGVSRVESVVTTGWVSECESDSCGIQVTPIEYTTPTTSQTVDVTVTITFDYRTSHGDAATAGMSLDDGTPPYEFFRPRSFPLRPTTKRTTTTLTWFKKDVVAAGHAYTIRFGSAPHDLNGNDHAEVSGRKLTIVVESWTAGD